VADRLAPQLFRVGLASFLVLFLEVAFIRWMPAYVRLLAYFSNFILLGAFLGIGLGCLLIGTRRRLFAWFPIVQLALILAVALLRLEIVVPTAGSIYFTSGTAEDVTVVESTLLLPVIFLGVVLLFTTLAHQMGREMAPLPPLPGYSANIVGSLAGVATFGALSWQQAPPAVWFAVGAAASLPFLFAPTPGSRARLSAPAIVNVALLGLAISATWTMGRHDIWSPYYKISVTRQANETVVSVNNIFHQSMAPAGEKEYFYDWPYTVFGDTFDDVLILGAGSGTDVAAALRHGVSAVDAVEIDPVILELGRELHPDQPYADPRVTVVNDDARHFLRKTDKQYDLVVFALIDSLTLQSGFSGVRLESYLFTEEAFEAVRDHLAPDGLLVVYNYFREPWLVDRLANSAALAFGEEPRVHVHEARAYLGVMLAGPRLRALTVDPPLPDRVAPFGQPHDPTPVRWHTRDAAIEPATDDWPYLYLRDRHMPSHYLVVLAFILAASALLIGLTRRGQPGRWSWQFFLLGAGFMLLETRAITQFSLLWGSTWIVASLAIASVLVMALAANAVVSFVEIRRPNLVGAALVALLGVNYLMPVGSVTFDSRVTESLFFALIGFSPIFCAGLLFGSAVQRSASLPRDFGTNLLGAMVGGAAEYLSLTLGFGSLLGLVGLFYLGALVARRREHLDRPAFDPSRV
jgi:SAM-dependent methyltransferase